MKTRNSTMQRAIAALAALGLSPLAVRAGEARELGVLDPGAGTAYIADGAAVSSAQTFHGDLVKQGAGSSSLSLADVHTAKGRIVAADGTLAVAGAVAANGPGAPLSVLSKAAVWLDASLPGTIRFYMDPKAKVRGENIPALLRDRGKNFTFSMKGFSGRGVPEFMYQYKAVGITVRDEQILLASVEELLVAMARYLVI